MSSFKAEMKSEIFNWEVPIETVPIPSGGKIYPKESWFHMKETIDIKSMTANEEDILASQAYIKKGIVVDELIKACIMDHNADPNDLLVGDKNALAISIRITGYGSDYGASVSCGKCGHVNDKVFNLTELGIKTLGATPTEPGVNCFEFTLPVSNKKVKFKLLTGKDQEDISNNIKNKRNMLGELSIGTITSNLESQILSIDGIDDFSKIKKFVSIMPAFDSRSLRSYISKIQPGIDMNVAFKCDNCGSESEANLPINVNFFWPPVVT